MNCGCGAHAPAHALARAPESGGGGSPRRKGGIIDVHHHFAPPMQIEWMEALGLRRAAIHDWSYAHSLEAMDRDGVSVSIVSAPDSWFGSDVDSARRIARESNDFVAQTISAHSHRFGHFARLPMPHVDGTLHEIAYAFDTLKADGVIIMTSYGNRWLGDPAFAPVLAELNRRKARVLVHPFSPECCFGLQPLIGDSTVEYGTDTTRTIASLMFSGALTRFPDISFVFSHAGGTITSIIGRLVLLCRRPQFAAMLPEGPEAELRKCHFDIAQASHRVTLGALIALVGVPRILFGSDFPFRTPGEHAQALRAFGLGAEDITAIETANALSLLPRLSSLVS